MRIGGIHVDNQYLNVNVRAKNGATLVVNDGISSYLHNSMNVVADKIIVGADNREGIFADGANINIKGDVEVTATGDNGKGLVAYLDSIIGVAGQSSGTYSTASLKVDGKATIESVNHAVQASGADINITDGVDIHSSDGIAVRAMAYRTWTSDTTNPMYSEERMANVSIVGGKIVADKYDAIHNEGSNVYLNSEGKNSLQVKGDVVMLDRNSHTANTIMKLVDDKSSWTGGLYTANYMIDNGANMQLTLQNGGTWTNKGENFNVYEGDSSILGLDYTATVANLTGGADESSAGLIFQNTSRDLNIKNYSGYTKVFYDHANDGTSISDFSGGDIIVGSAAEDSHIDIITDKEGINSANTYQVNTVLNNLAQKLVYTGAIAAQNNLSGKAIIAESLTSNSQAVAMNKITFDKETGRGYLGNYISQLVTEFTTPLTGVAANDTVYSDAYVLQETGEYKFTKDSSINVSGKNAAAIDLKAPATIIAGGTTLALNVTEASGNAAGINMGAAGTTQMGANALAIKTASSNSAYGIFQTAGNNVIDSNIAIEVSSSANAGASEKTIGVYANDGTLTINGDVNATVTNNGIGFEHYGSHGLYATGKGGSSKGADIVVNGKVTFAGAGNGLTTNMGGASITVDSVDITVDKDSELNYAAIRAENGTINVNIERDASGAIVGGAGNAVNIKGNVGLGDGAVYYADVLGSQSAVNLALNTADSTLQGIIFNQYGTEGVVATGGDAKFTGDSNLWLQNGASWINEQYGGIDTPNYGGLEYTGSFVSNFVGGSNTSTAGNIFQKDTNPLTINNYSGVTNIFYAHTGDGTARDNYAAGDTIVNHADEGSSIYMLTDNSNITVENRTQVNKVLNALAGKLVYTGFVGGKEDNLQGMVGIAEGLTSSSAVKVVKGISFSEEDGRGSYSTGEHGSDTFNAPITGTEADTEYFVAGVTSDYSDYTFDPLDYESKKVTILSGERPGIIFNSGKDVYINAPLLNIEANGGITASRDAENPWMGSYLSINTINEEGASGKVIIHKETGDAVNASADVRIYGQAEITSGGNGLVATIVGTNPGSIEITKGTTIQAEKHGILAEGGSVMLDSGYNNIVAKGDAIHAVAVEVNPAGTAYKTGGYVYVEGGNIESTSTEGKAVYSDGGTIYINAGGDHTTTMKGDVVASNGSQVNIKLTDADSKWEGHLSNNDSNVAITMKNGAEWLNGDGAMSINSLTGAEALDSAANIFRGKEDLTIDYLSGAMNFYYAHENDGDQVDDYAAYGDTIIKSAEAGSVVKLITDKNDNFDIENIDTYKGVLDALAHKLVYSGFASGERNLNGYVAIAEGLTSSSAELTVNTITFSNENGQGSYIEVYENGITGTPDDDRYGDKGDADENFKVYNFGPQNGVNMAIPNVMLQVVDKPLDVTINSVEALDFKEKVYVSPDNTVTINAPKGININNGWINAIDSAGGKIVLNKGALNVYTAGKGLVADTVVKTEAQKQLNRAGVININESANITSYGESVFANGGTININKGGKFSTLYGDYPDAMTVTSDTIVAMEKVVTPYGDASEAELYQGVVNIKGDADNRINIQSNSNALYSEGGIININQDNAATVIMTGFISGHASENGTAPEFNVNLTNENSRWEGRIRVDDKAQVNLTLQDGGTWATYRYYQADNNTPQLYLNNRVSNFVGSTGDQKAGIIRMTDYIDLNLENYSGNTIVYYGHLMGYDGTEKWHYEDGVQKADVHVGSAAEGSVITVMTDKDDINLNNQEQVNKVLNTLASFLVYDGYVKGERNLTGQVAIAQSLTASDMWAVLPEAEKMSFDEATGRGYYVGVLPGVYKSAITGTSADTEYSDRGVVTNQDPMTDAYIYNQYDFTAAANGNLVVVPNIAIEYGNNVTVNSEVDMQVDGGIKVLYAKELTMNGAEGTTLNIDTEGAAAVTTSGGTVNINSDMVIKSTGNGLESIYTERDMGVRPVYITVTGDVTAETVGNAVLSNGGYVTIDGVVDLKSEADTVVAKAKALSFENGNAKVAIQGGSISSKNGYAIYNEGSDVKVNDGGTTTTIINGNIYQKDVSVGADWHTSYYVPTTTLKLTDADSAWKGSLETSGSNTFNLTLQNGATWTDAVVANNAGNTISSFTGSTGEQAAGNIFRNDTRNLTINNYSGNTNIYYEHAATENGGITFAAGDTIINSAAAGSNVTLITQKGNIDVTVEEQVNTALNALANKLLYHEFVNDVHNLTGKVAIAEGLTTQSQLSVVGDINFDATGRGVYGTVTPVKYANGIAGSSADTEYYEANITTDYTNYNFTVFDENSKVYVPFIDISYIPNDSSSIRDLTISNPEGTLVVNNTTKDVAVKTHTRNITFNDDVLINSTGVGLYAESNVSPMYSDTIKANKLLTISSAGNGFEAHGGWIYLNGGVDITSGADAIHIEHKVENGTQAQMDMTVSGGSIKSTAQNGNAIYVAGGNGIKVNAGTKNKVAIDGNISLQRGTTGSNGSAKGSATINLNTEDSYWNGNLVVFAEDMGYSNMNLTLANGATWRQNAQQEASQIETFAGGNSVENAGNIYRAGSGDMTIKSYSGFANIFYGHESSDPVKMIGGDTIINNAVYGSSISLITDNTGVTTTNYEDVLSALAAKLVYTDAGNNASNLKGKVSIAEGLTTADVVKYFGTLGYDDNGRGVVSNSEAELTQTTIDSTITGNYTFTHDINNINTTNTEAIKLGADNYNLDATGKVVNINVTSDSGTNALVYDSGTKRNAKLNVNANDISIALNAAGNASAVSVVGYNTTTFNSDMDIIAKTTAGNHVTGIYLGKNSYSYNKAIINGNLTMRDGEDGYGVTNGNTIGNTIDANYNVAGIDVNCFDLDIKGLIDLKVDGTGLVVRNSASDSGRVNIKGGSIEVNRNPVEGIYNYAIEAYNGGKNIQFNSSAASDVLVNIKGNIGLLTPGRSGNILNLGLANAESSWTGVMHDVNGTSTVTLKNGATWNNELWGPTYDAAGAFQGSVIDTFVGGSTAETAGNIYQKDSNDLTLSKYSGWTNVYYAHNDETPDTMIGGDTIIGSAAAGSGITMITENNGVTTANVADVLSALAGKLVYTANNGNLTGKLSIAEGLTSGGLTATGDITFGEGGVGTYAGGATITEPLKELDHLITGTEYIEENSVVNSTTTSAITLHGGKKVDATGYRLVANGNYTSDTSVVLFDLTNRYSFRDTINADVLDVNLNTTGSGSGIEVIGGYNATNGSYDGVVLNTNVNINAASNANKAVNGLYLHGNSSNKVPLMTITGDLTMKNGEGYGVTNGGQAIEGATSNYGATGILAVGKDAGYEDTQLTVLGKTDLKIDGTAVVATKQATINLQGETSIEVNKDAADGLANYALETTYGSTINANNTKNIKGNIGVIGGGTINLGFSGQGAQWTGVAHKSTDNGTTAITLKNGATWNNETWGNTYGDTFNGSNVTRLTGGDSAETAGNIYQKDSHELYIDQLTGWMNVHYDHADGTPLEMIGGDTRINSTSGTAGITMITENNGITEANVANVLNALAQKLVFNGNGSLTGKLSIAEGLTSGGITATGDITFVDGRGTYNVANATMETSLNRGIMLAEENGSTEEGTVTPDAPATPTEPVIVTNPLVAEGTERTVTDQVKIQLTEKGDAITAKGTDEAPGMVAVMNDAFISAESGSLDNRNIYGNAVYAEGSTVALNPEGGKEIILKGDVVLKGTATEEAVAGSSAIIVLDTATSSWQGNLYNDDASSAAVTLQNGAIWNNRDNNREEALGITGHKVSNFTGGATAEAAGNFFQNNEKDMVFDQYSGYTKVFFGHLNDGSDAKDYTAGNLIINSAAAGSGITMITNQSYNIDINDEEQVNKILNSLAGKLFYNGYANGERNLTANVQIAESLTGSSKFLTGGVLNFNSNGQGYYGKEVHIAGIYTTDITGSAADSEFINAGVTEDYKSYNFTDSVEGASKVILQGIKVAGDTGNYKDEKKITINIVADQAELNDSINIGYRGTVNLKADTVTIKGVENTAIDNYGGTLVVDGNVEISDVANGIHTNSKAEVAGNEYIGTVDIKGQAKITAENTAIATEGGVVSVGAGSEITSTNGDAIVAQGQRLFSMQVGYYDREVAGEVNVAGGTISAANGNAINAAGGHVYVNKNSRNDTKITGNILVAEDNTTVGTQTEDTPQQSIVDITLNTKDSSWKGSLSVAEGQMMNLTLQNGATWTDAISELAGNTISNFIGGASSKEAGTIVRNDTRDLTIDNYSGWTNIYYEHEKDDATKMIGGDTIIKKAVEVSGINMITGSYGVDTNDKQQVADVLNALAKKLWYKEAYEQKAEENGAEAVMFAAANDDNSTANTFKLQAKAVISEGLTTTSKEVASGTINFKTEDDGQGSVTIEDVEISGGESGGDKHIPLDKVEIITGGEPVTMRAIKSSMAAATMMWRSENNDLMKRMGDLRVLEGERGLWAKYYTGKQEMDAQDTNFSEKYKAYQIGYDTKVNENWIVGAALSYNDGTSSTSNVANGATGAWANGHGEQKNISLGVYGSWKAKDGQYADIIMKASRLNNEYNLKFNNGIGTYDIDGDYKTWGTSISAEYGKRFEGDKGTYFEPSAELTYGHMAGKSYSAGTNYYGSTMYMDQDGFDTLVGRIGLRVGQKLENGSYFAKLALAHEFMGDYDTRYNVDGKDHNSTHLEFGDSWYELQIGGTAKLSANSMLYADFQRSFGGDVTEKWHVDAGLRFTF